MATSNQVQRLCAQLKDLWALHTRYPKQKIVKQISQLYHEM